MRQRGLTITLENRTRRAVPLAALKRHLLRVAGWLGVRGGDWSITLVGDRAMAGLHQRTMNLPTTTDVLTFDMADATHPRSGRVELDSVLCVDEAARQARSRTHELWQELLLYAIHSLLHIRGYDDLTPAEAQRMHRREDQLLTRLGIGPVFGVQPSGGGARDGAHGGESRPSALRAAGRRPRRCTQRTAT